jgi:hypothetical protein
VNTTSATSKTTARLQRAAADLGRTLVADCPFGRFLLATQGGDVAFDQWVEVGISGVRLGPGWTAEEARELRQLMGGGVS